MAGSEEGKGKGHVEPAGDRRAVDFIVSVMRSHWRAISGAVIRSNLFIFY